MFRMRSLAVYAVVVAVVGLVGGIGAAHHRKTHRSYLGKPLKYWFNQLPQTRSDGGRDLETMRSPSGAVRRWGSFIETPQASANAIRDMGTNVLAFYLRKLTRSVGPREIQIAKAARIVGFEDFWIRGADSERGQAVTALILLKPLPPEVVSELVALSTNRDQDIADAARCALRTKENELLFLHPRENHPNIFGRSPLLNLE